MKRGSDGKGGIAQKKARLRASGRSRTGRQTVQKPVGHVHRTLQAVDYLSRRVSASGDDVAMAIRVHRRTALRLLEVMVESGWAATDPLDRTRYQLTPKVVTVAGAVLGRSSVVHSAAPFLKTLRDKLNESSHFAVVHNGWAVQILEELSPLPLSFHAAVGELVPIHASAIGKAMAAYLPDQVALAVVRGLNRFTPNTITSLDLLEEELAGIRGRGYAVDDQELHLDTRCIASAVRNVQGDVVGSVGVSGPASRITRERTGLYGAIVREHAARLSAAMGYAPDSGPLDVQPD